MAFNSQIIKNINILENLSYRNEKIKNLLTLILFSDKKCVSL